ncbi:hypothetical protein LCGC14_2557010 [marine sediment metagenome]|uniref:Uncharacterized protein n=1 Tax=marine sediment metagenome TaxID=412755 RepID=A0A0F9B963_9ZZZZ
MRLYRVAGGGESVDVYAEDRGEARSLANLPCKWKEKRALLVEVCVGLIYHRQVGRPAGSPCRGKSVRDGLCASHKAATGDRAHLDG